MANSPESHLKSVENSWQRFPPNFTSQPSESTQMTVLYFLFVAGRNYWIPNNNKGLIFSKTILVLLTANASSAASLANTIITVALQGFFEGSFVALTGSSGGSSTGAALTNCSRCCDTVTENVLGASVASLTGLAASSTFSSLESIFFSSFTTSSKME